jgi:hypothetical protein
MLPNISCIACIVYVYRPEARQRKTLVNVLRNTLPHVSITEDEKSKQIINNLNHFITSENISIVRRVDDP